MANPIVTLNVSQISPPIPSTLQQTGAIISVGATTLTGGTYSLLNAGTIISDLGAILNGAASLSALAWAAGTVTATTTVAHGLPVGLVTKITLAGQTPAGYAGTFVCTVTTTDQFTYAVASDPGTATAFGTWILANVAEVTRKATSFAAQGGNQSIYVLELGQVSDADALTQLSSFEAKSPNFFYGYCAPDDWDTTAGFTALLAGYEALDAWKYFYINTTLPLTAPSAPTLTANATGGTLATGTVYVVVTLTSGDGETVASAEANVAVTGPTGQVVVTPPTQGTADGWKVYASDTSGQEVLQTNTALAFDGNSYNLDSLAASIVVPPSSNTTGYGKYTTAMKDAAWFLASPNALTTEDISAAGLYNLLMNRPGPGNQMPQMQYRPLYGITPWPSTGYAAEISSILAAHGNLALVGSEGGLTNVLLYGGTMADGNNGLYWYAADWVEINLKLNLANEIMNGSATSVAPLKISQDGINRLQTRGYDTLGNGIQFGLLVGSLKRTRLDGATFSVNMGAGQYDGFDVINAVPYLTYYQESPGDYKTGTYNGLGAQIIPAAGFNTIQVNLVISGFVA